MKCNKDEGQTLFQAIDAVDDKYLVETLEDMQKRKGQNHKQQFKQMTPMVKAATITLICFLSCMTIMLNTPMRVCASS